MRLSPHGMMMKTEELVCKIQECYDCPRFEKRKVRHFLIDGYAWELHLHQGWQIHHPKRRG